MDPMEKWEIELRERLEQDIPEGIYSIVIEGKKYLTGRGGVIDQMVEEERGRRYPPQELGNDEGI
jgi:hypothetical protein